MTKFYALEKSNDGTATIHLYDEVGAFGSGSKEFLADLGKLDGQHIHLRINSPGGSVVEGTAIYNALRRHKGGLTVHIDALAASMASVIAMSGSPVYIADNALLMIHNPWTVSAGDSDQLRKEADLLDKLKSTLVNAYVRKTGMEQDQVADDGRRDLARRRRSRGPRIRRRHRGRRGRRSHRHAGKFARPI